MSEITKLTADEMWDLRFCSNGHLLGWNQGEEDNPLRVWLLKCADRAVCITCGEGALT